MTEVILPEPREVEKTITLQIRSWRQKRLGRPDLRLVGIDNVQFLRPSEPGNTVFIDNAGGLVAFPRGRGGFFLNQLKFMKNEPNRENTDKKLRIWAILLQNMGIASRSSR